MNGNWVPIERYKELVPRLLELEELYRAVQTSLIKEVTGHDHPACKRCNRPMVQRRYWQTAPEELRRMLPQFRRTGAQGYCNSCYKFAVADGEVKPAIKKRGGPLSDEEVMRLRRLEGLPTE